MQRALWIAVGLSGLVVGCDRAEPDVRVQPAPKLARPTMQSILSEVGRSSAAPRSGAQTPIHWTVPAGWKELPADQMRFAAFAVSEKPPIEVTVIPLALEWGGLLANVNRWLGQIGMPPTTEQELPKLATRIQAAEQTIDVVDLKGPASANPPVRMLAAVTQFDNRTWVIKLVGAADVVSAQKANFDAFVNSIHFAHETQEEVAAAPPQSAEAAADASGIAYSVPDGWRKEPPQQMRHASFLLGAADEPAEVIITRLPAGAFGTLHDNLNRWRGQVDLPPITEAESQPSVTVQVDGVEASQFDFVGPGAAPQTKRLLLVAAPVGNSIWFFKLTGPAHVVAAEQPAFDGFIRSVRFAAGP